MLDRGAQVEVKNKKGNSPLWLAANGGHLPVIEMLYAHNADIDSQDNRKVSCLMAAFRKGHVRVAKWMVQHVTQFPSDQEMMRFIATSSDKELLDKCDDCVKIIRAAKETQAAKANENASNLLEELESERTKEESKRVQAAKRRERKKKKRLEKKEQQKKLLEENQKNESYDDVKKESKGDVDDAASDVAHTNNNDKEEGDSGIDANSQGSCSSNDIKEKSPKEKRKNKKNKKGKELVSKPEDLSLKPKASTSKDVQAKSDVKDKENKEPKTPIKVSMRKSQCSMTIEKSPKSMTFDATTTKSPADRDDFEATGNETYVAPPKAKKSNEDSHNYSHSVKNTIISPKQAAKREEGWKEVVRKSSVQTVSESGVKKVSVPLNAISRVIGRGGSNINAIRQHTNALIEVEKQSKGQGERIITIKGTPEITKQAHNLIATLIKDPEVDIMSILPKTSKAANTTTTLWDKTQIGTKKNAGKLVISSQSVTALQQLHSKLTSTSANTTQQSTSRYTTSSMKYRQSAPPSTNARTSAPRMMNHSEKAQQSVSANPVRLPTATATYSRSATAKTITTNASQTFAEKLTENVVSSVPTSNIGVSAAASNVVTAKPRTALNMPSVASSQICTPTPISNVHNSPSKNAPRPAPTGSAPPSMQHFQPPASKSQSQLIFGSVIPSNHNQTPATSMNEVVPTTSIATTASNIPAAAQPPQQKQPQEEMSHPPVGPTSQYTLFCPVEYFWSVGDEHKKNFASAAGGGNSQSNTQQHKFIDQEPPPQVDITKAPGYRGVAVCSPVSSKTSSNSTTPPNLSGANSFPIYQEATKPQNTLPPIGSRAHTTQQDFSPFMDYSKPPSTLPLLSLGNESVKLLQNINTMPLNFSQGQPQVNMQQPGGINQRSTLSNLNPGALEYPGGYNSIPNKNVAPPLYNGYPMNMPNNMFANKGNMEVSS